MVEDPGEQAGEVERTETSNKCSYWLSFNSPDLGKTKVDLGIY